MRTTSSIPGTARSSLCGAKTRSSSSGFMKTLGTQLGKARKLRQFSQTALAKEIGTSPNQISMIENGHSGTSIRTMVAAATALNVSLDFLAGLIEDPRSARDLLYDLKAAHARAIHLQAARQDPPTSEYYTHIEVSEIETAGGSGVTLDGKGVKNMIQFPANWLRNRGLTASECRVISVKDESMEPTLAAGCSILIHLTRRRRTDRIYVIRTGDERIVKRAVRSNEAGWMLVSDNPDKDRFPTRPWADDAKVIGEVKWYGQSFK